MEEIRDGLLALDSSLDLTMGGPFGGRAALTKSSATTEKSLNQTRASGARSICLAAQSA
jgi:hypothetical protein